MWSIQLLDSTFDGVIPAEDPELNRVHFLEIQHGQPRLPVFICLKARCRARIGQGLPALPRRQVAAALHGFGKPVDSVIVTA